MIDWQDFLENKLKLKTIDYQELNKRINITSLLHLKDVNGDTLFHIVTRELSFKSIDSPGNAIFKQNLGMLKRQLTKTGNLLIPNNKGETPYDIHLTTFNADSDFKDVNIKNNALVKLNNMEGINTYINDHFENNIESFILFLSSECIHINSTNITPLQLLARAGKYDVIQMIELKRKNYYNQKYSSSISILTNNTMPEAVNTDLINSIVNGTDQSSLSYNRTYGSWGLTQAQGNIIQAAKKQKIAIVLQIFTNELDEAAGDQVKITAAIEKFKETLTTYLNPETLEGKLTDTRRYCQWHVLGTTDARSFLQTALNVVSDRQNDNQESIFSSYQCTLLDKLALYSGVIGESESYFERFSRMKPGVDHSTVLLAGCYSP